MAQVIHPPLTHFPVALFTLGSLVYLYGVLKNDEKFIDRSVFMVIIGAVIGVFTGLAGIVDATQANIFPTLRATLAATTIILYFIGYYLHTRGQRNIALVVFLIGLITVLATGYLGGELVYTYGTNVG